MVCPHPQPGRSAPPPTPNRGAVRLVPTPTGSKAPPHRRVDVGRCGHRDQHDIFVCARAYRAYLKPSKPDVTDGGRRSLLGDCDWLGARFRYVHSYSVLGRNPIPVRVRLIGPAPSTSTAVTRVAGVGGECAAISVSDGESLYTNRLSVHVVRCHSVRRAYIGMHSSLPEWRILMVLQIRSRRRFPARQHMEGKSAPIL